MRADFLTKTMQVATLALAIALPGVAGAAGVASTFDSGTEGWLLAGDSTTANPQWFASGGNPGGYIHGIDTVTGGVWYWQAPAAFLGNQAASYGQNLSFDLRMRGSGTLFASSDVVIGGNGQALHLDLSTLPADVSWTHYSVALAAGAGWKLGSLSGAAADASQIQSVLGNVTSLRIRGEFITGSDNGDLDNVVLAAVPEPEVWALWLAGIGMLAGMARRRKAR